jgi:hypothetical protein
MPTNLNAQILQSLRAMTPAEGPATFNHLARKFGATAPVVASVARLLVAEGQAVASYADIHGKRTMFGLLPLPPASDKLPG